MLPLTKQERLVIIFISSVLLMGSLLQYLYRRFSSFHNFLDFINQEEFHPRVDINRASLEELMSLPLIGEKTALAIIEYRRVHGFFKDVEDVRWVKGIGPHKLKKIKKYLVVRPFQKSKT